MDIQLNKWINEIAFLEINGSQKYQKYQVKYGPISFLRLKRLLFLKFAASDPYFKTIFQVYPNFCSISKVLFKRKIE